MICPLPMLNFRSTKRSSNCVAWVVEATLISATRMMLAAFGVAIVKFWPYVRLDGADVIPPPSGTRFFSTNPANGLCVYRTPGQVLYLAYGLMAGVTKGAFFPSGVNGVLNTSSGPATAANLT